MYSGCVICEVRNYRGPHLLQREGLPMYDSNLVLLKPTAEVSCNFVHIYMCVCVCVYIHIYIMVQRSICVILTCQQGNL